MSLDSRAEGSPAEKAEKAENAEKSAELRRAGPERAAAPGPGRQEGPGRPGERGGPLVRLWRRLRRWLRQGREREPFDFGRFDFPRLDLDRTAERLRLVELAEENARHEIPASSDEAFDAPQERIEQFIRGEVARIGARYETSLAGLNSRIRALDVPKYLLHISEVPRSFQQKLETLAQEAQHKLANAREVYERRRAEYQEFRERNQLRREPHYPDSKFNLVALLLAVGVLEGLVNAYFFAQGSDFGYLGGALYALLLAAVDVLIVFNLGRLMAWMVSRQWGYRAAALGALAIFLAWATGFNLLVGHVREGLQTNPDGAMRVALDTFRNAPLGLSQADSWVLVAIGLALSVLAMIDGLGWDEKVPRYGALHRELVLARDDLQHWKRTWTEHTLALQEQLLARIDALLRDLHRDRVALGNTIGTKTLLMRNLRNFASHYEESDNALMRIYRDHNQRSRSSPPPAYVKRPWRIRLPDRLTDSTQEDEKRLQEARAAEQRAERIAARAREETRSIYSGFRKRRETEEPI